MIQRLYLKGGREERGEGSESILKMPPYQDGVKQGGRDVIKHLCEINNVFLMSSFQIIV